MYSYLLSLCIPRSICIPNATIHASQHRTPQNHRNPRPLISRRTRHLHQLHRGRSSGRSPCSDTAPAQQHIKTLPLIRFDSSPLCRMKSFAAMDSPSVVTGRPFAASPIVSLLLFTLSILPRLTTIESFASSLPDSHPMKTCLLCSAPPLPALIGLFMGFWLHTPWFWIRMATGGSCV